MTATLATLAPPRPYTVVDSLLGEIVVAGAPDAVTALWFAPPSDPDGWERDDAGLAPVARRLEEYFAGRRRGLDVPVRLEGSPFEQRVWQEVQAIPYGRTASYAEIAWRIGHPGAARAVGRANARNPVCLVVPCHRVVGSDGSLTGYAGGLERKRALLALERGERLGSPLNRAAAR
jgi:methylated-DNA-[protein]-cysteine S-methyltransferase